MPRRKTSTSTFQANVSTSRKSRAANVVKKYPQAATVSIRYPCACNSGNCNYVTKRKKTADRERPLRGKRTRETHNKREKAYEGRDGRGRHREKEKERKREAGEEEVNGERRTFRGNKYRKERNRQEWQTTVGPCICPSIFDIHLLLSLVPCLSLRPSRSLSQLLPPPTRPPTPPPSPPFSTSIISAALSPCHAARNPPLM